MWNDYLKLTRDELYKKVWSTPTCKLKEELGISDVMIGKICKKNGIPKPPLGYWARVRAGQQVRPAPLPKLKDGQREDIYLRQTPPDPLKLVRADAKRKAGTVERVPVPIRWWRRLKAGLKTHNLICMGCLSRRESTKAWMSGSLRTSSRGRCESCRRLSER